MLHTKLLPPTHSPDALPQTPLFADALAVRIAVFVHEQHIPLDLEVDADDPRSWHWVVYDDHTPIATARLVPPPHAPRDAHHPQDGTPPLPPRDELGEPCVRIGRVAVRKESRGRGVAVDLLRTILDWAGQNSRCVQEAYTRGLTEGEKIPPWEGRWKGLVRVHSQVPVQRVYARVGFEPEESMGRWMEDGIEHVGMVRRIPLLEK